MVAQVQFFGTGDLSGGGFYSQIRDAVQTPGGIVAVGTATLYSGGTGSGDSPVLWTPAGGLVPLANDYPSNTSDVFVAARVISADGTVIGGSAYNAPSGRDRSPALWSNHGSTLTRLGFLGGANFFPNVGVNCLSSDGAVAYGFTRWNGGAMGAFRYTASGGMVSIGFLNPGDDTIVPQPHSALPMARWWPAIASTAMVR